MGTVPFGKSVDVVHVQGRRAQITSPLNGWVSLFSASGMPILVPTRVADAKQKISPDVRPPPRQKSWGSLLPARPAISGGLLESALQMFGQQSSRIAKGAAPILEETFYCAVCLENRRKQRAFRLTACAHSFCKECLEGYLRAQIENRQTHPRCFAPDSKDGPCGVEIDPVDIKAAADSGTLLKYHRWVKKDEKNFVECPKCKLLQRGDPRRPWLTCASVDCGQQFCFTHQTRHSAETPCAAFEAAERVRQRRDQRYMSKHTRRCPRCAAPTEKNRGCNHMTCYVCKAGWCWLCGIEIGNAPIPPHYRHDGPCRGRQFASGVTNEVDTDAGNDDFGPPLGPWEGCCCVAIPSTFILCLSPLAFALSCVALFLSPISVLILCMCSCTQEIEGQATSCLRGFLQILVLGPTLLAGLPLWAPCFLYFVFVVEPRRQRWLAGHTQQEANQESGGVASDDAPAMPVEMRSIAVSSDAQPVVDTKINSV